MEFKLSGLNFSGTKQKPQTKVKPTSDEKPAQSFDNSLYDNTLKAQEAQGRAFVTPHDTNKAGALSFGCDYEYDSFVFEDISEFDKEDLEYFKNLFKPKEETNSSESTDIETVAEEQEKRFEEFKNLLDKYKDNKDALEQIDEMLSRHELLFVLTADERFYDETQYPRNYTRLITPDSNNTDKYLSDLEKTVYNRVVEERKLLDDINSNEAEY